MLTRNVRTTNFSDRNVQGALLLRVAGHWLGFLAAAAIVLLFIEMFLGEPRDAWRNLVDRHGPTVLAVLVLSPLFLRDLVKLSNRFAGPMVRLRRAMHDLAEGCDVAPIQFRKHDFWKDLAEDFNRVAARMKEAGATVPRTENVKEAPVAATPSDAASRNADAQAPELAQV